MTSAAVRPQPAAWPQLPDDPAPYSALQPPRYDVFLSHKRDDCADFARVLHGELKQRGYKVFLDEEATGDIVDLLTEVRSSAAFIFVLSSHVFSSQWCVRELRSALRASLRVVPVVHPGARWEETHDFPPPQCVHPEVTDVLRPKAVRYTREFHTPALQSIVDRLPPPIDGAPAADAAAVVAPTPVPAAAARYSPTDDIEKEFQAGFAKRHEQDDIAALDATDHFRRAAEAGHPAAQYHLARRYHEGRGEMRSLESARQWYEKAAESGYAGALVRLARMYQYGEGAPKSDSKAAELFQQAATSNFILRGAAHGDAELQYLLGCVFRDCPGAAQSDAKALLWLRKAAEQGLAEGIRSVGWMYYMGRGVTQSDEEAASWYRKAAELGDPAAQNNLARCYAEGQGVPQSLEQAAELWRQAAELGNAGAQCCLGYGYANGEGVPQSDEEAALWYRKAAEQGHATAQFNLGYCYADGLGVEQSHQKAMELFRKAADQEHAGAQKALLQLESPVAQRNRDESTSGCCVIC